MYNKLKDIMILQIAKDNKDPDYEMYKLFERNKNRLAKKLGFKNSIDLENIVICIMMSI